MSLNLHGIVRTAINFNNADETVLLIRSLGNANIQGRIVPTYGEPESVGAQVQTLGGEDLRVMASACAMSWLPPSCRRCCSSARGSSL